MLPPRIVAVGSVGEPPVFFPAVPGFSGFTHQYRPMPANKDPMSVLLHGAIRFGAMGVQEIRESEAVVTNGRATLRRYWERVGAFCLGRESTGLDEDLTAQVPDWSPLLGRVRLALIAPGDRVWNPVSARAVLRHQTELAGEVDRFLRRHYRALPVPPEFEPITDGSLRAIRATDRRNWNVYQAFLRDLVAFAEPRLHPDSGPEVLNVTVPGLADRLTAAENVRTRATAALAESTSDSAALVATLNNLISELAEITGDLSGIAREAHRDGRL
jgi:hypothetical protein